MLTITVGKNDEDYTSIQEAVNAIPYDVEAEIVISPGVYREKVFSDKASLSIRGIGNPVITWADCGYEILDRNRKRGTFRSYTAFFGGGRVCLSGLTIRNGSGTGCGQGIALYLDAEEAMVENVCLEGHQDTLFLAPLPDEEREVNGFYGPRHLLPRRRTLSYFRGSRIEGTVDFIFGSEDALFEDCDIVSRGPGFVAAPSGKKDWPGLAFSRCRFTSLPDIAGEVYLMRPWRKEGKALFFRCDFGRHIAPEGLIAWPGREAELPESSFFVCSCDFRGTDGIDAQHVMDEEKASELLRAFHLNNAKMRLNQDCARD